MVSNEVRCCKAVRQRTSQNYNQLAVREHCGTFEKHLVYVTVSPRQKSAVSG